jgi:hypothetical protein
MGVCLSALLGFAAFGFDLTYLRYARLELQNATDAAAHAALVRLRATGSLAQAQQAAITVAGQNRVWGSPLTLRTQDITFGGWDFTGRRFQSGVVPANAVQVVGARSTTVGTNGPIALTFGRVLGVKDASMVHRGTAAYRIRSILVAQDITGSFSGSIDQAAAADVALLDQLYAYHIPADRIGMMLFTGDATLFTPLTNLQSSYTTVRLQWKGDGKTAFDATKVSGITTCNKLDLSPTYGPPFDHAWVPHCSSGGDGTNQGAAISAAIDALNASSKPYESRTIVLITDGRPACCTLSGGSVSCSETNACAMARADQGTKMANAATAAGINVFTVSFGADAAQSAYNASLARGSGTAYNTPDATQLSTILSTIAGAIPIAFVQ